jgi:hypothetical protein
MEHVLEASDEQFWAEIFRSEEFNRALYIGHLGFGYELESWDPTTYYRRARIWPLTNVPKALTDLLGGEISFVEDGSCDEAAGPYDFRIIPSRLRERIGVKGRVETTPLTDRTCRRIVTLEIDVRMFGIGGVIESLLEATTREQYDKNAAFINEYLAAGN